MPASLALTTPATPLRGPVGAGEEARLAVWSGALEPPSVERFAEADGAALIEVLYCRAAAASSVPALALREMIENLVHAGFADALVSVLDGGRTVRVSDRGPGVADPVLALLPGFTTADAPARRVVRGVGGGLPLAAALMEERGGALELTDNLGGGTVVTLSVPGPEGEADPAGLSEAGRRLLALLVELAPAHPGALAEELGLPAAECGRELALLEHRGLVDRAADGTRALAEPGAVLVATLF